MKQLLTTKSDFRLKAKSLLLQGTNSCLHQAGLKGSGVTLLSFIGKWASPRSQGANQCVCAGPRDPRNRFSPSFLSLLVSLFSLRQTEFFHVTENILSDALGQYTSWLQPPVRDSLTFLHCRYQNSREGSHWLCLIRCPALDQSTSVKEQGYMQPCKPCGWGCSF